MVFDHFLDVGSACAEESSALSVVPGSYRLPARRTCGRLVYRRPARPTYISCASFDLSL